MLRKTIIAVITAALMVCAGCQSQAESKKAAKERWNKASAQIKLNLAEQQYAEGKFSEAIKTIRQCLSADPDNSLGHMLYGKLLLADGRRDEAAEQFTLAVESDIELHESWYWFGVAAQENRDYTKAYECYNTALSFEPTNVDYILAVADVQVATGKCSDAMDLLDVKMSVIPHDVSLKVAAADLMLRQGETQKASRLYKESALLTGDSDIAESLGYCYILDGRWDEASDVFQELVSECEDEQKSKSLLRLLAICNMSANRYVEAVNCYSKLAVEERDNAQFWLQMGQAALGAGEANKAFMCGQKALGLQPGYADAIALVGCVQYASGDYTAAAGSFERIATDKENGGFAWLMRARCYEQLGRISEAKRAYHRAMEMNPRSELASLLAKGKDIRD
jgi:tetratricopeptide (TPR) repeat protein